MRDHDVLDNNPFVSRSALEALHSQSFGWALSRCNFDQATAEDLMQQAYVEILSGRARFDNKSALKTFLFGVIQNLARGRLRKAAVRLRLIKTFGPFEELVTEADSAAGEGQSQQIWQAVEALPARQRDITELVFCRDMTIENASAVMGVTAGTGRGHYDRAKKALAATLSGLQGD